MYSAMEVFFSFFRNSIGSHLKHNRLLMLKNIFWLVSMAILPNYTAVQFFLIVQPGRQKKGIF